MTDAAAASWMGTLALYGIPGVILGVFVLAWWLVPALMYLHQQKASSKAEAPPESTDQRRAA